MSSAGALFYQLQVCTVFYQDILEHSMLPPVELCGDTGFVFQDLEHFSKEPVPGLRF